MKYHRSVMEAMIGRMVLCLEKLSHSTVTVATISWEWSQAGAWKTDCCLLMFHPVKVNVKNSLNSIAYLCKYEGSSVKRCPSIEDCLKD